MMKYKPLGKTGVSVSEICLGTNNFGRPLNEESSREIIRKAIDLGVNIIDTANTYAEGKSEEMIGKAIRGDRSRMILSTKVGSPVGPGPNERGLSRKHIIWQLSESLRKLKTDYIDVYYMHYFDTQVPLEETLRALDYLVREGKILYVACSNKFSVEQITEANKICERFDYAKIVAVQPPYNLMQRDIEKDLLPFCRENSLGVFTYSPLMGGFLTGKYSFGTAPQEGTRYKSRANLWEKLNKPEVFESLRKLLKIADDAKIPLGHLAIAWILRNPAVTSLIAGASRPEQLEETCRLAESFKAPEDVMKQLDSTSIPTVRIYG